jgi:hypothetical protein
MIALTANRLILSDVCWGFVEASLNERQAEKFWGEGVGAQGMPDPQVTQIDTLLSTSSF